MLYNHHVYFACDAMKSPPLYTTVFYDLMMLPVYMGGDTASLTFTISQTAIRSKTDHPSNTSQLLVNLQNI